MKQKLKEFFNLDVTKKDIVMMVISLIIGYIALFITNHIIFSTTIAVSIFCTYTYIAWRKDYNTGEK